MKITFAWRAVAAVAFVAAFISIGACGALIYQLNRVIDVQNQIVETVIYETD